MCEEDFTHRTRPGICWDAIQKIEESCFIGAEDLGRITDGDI